MAIQKNDTVTTLFAGAGGDNMDESLVTQDDGSTVAKRPRVVLSLDSGELINMKGPLPVSLQSEDREILRDIRDALNKLVALGGGLS